MNEFHKLMIIGGGLGMASRLASLFPEKRPARELTPADRAAMDAAEAKRQRRAARAKAGEARRG